VLGESIEFRSGEGVMDLVLREVSLIQNGLSHVLRGRSVNLCG